MDDNKHYTRRRGSRIVIKLLLALLPILIATTGWGEIVAADDAACYALTLKHTGQGADPTTNPAKSEDCTTDGKYEVEEDIILTAVPAAGWRVKSWSGTEDDDSTADTNSVTMPAEDHTVSVTYEQIPVICYSLTLTHTGQGKDLVASPANSQGCSAGKYIAEQIVNLTADPDDGWRVKSWSGTEDDDSTADTNSVTMPGEDHVASVSYITTARVFLPVSLKPPAWIAIGTLPADANLYTASVCPEDPAIRYAGGRNDFYRWESGNWAKFSGAPTNVRDILFPQAGCDGAYMASYTNGVMKLNGNNWAPVGPELPTARSLVRRDGHLYLAAQSGLFRRAEADANDARWTPIKEEQDFTRLSQAGNRIYAAVFGQGVWYNDSCAAPLQQSCIWTPLAPPPFSDAFDVVGSEKTPPDWVVMATARGLYRWNGQKWSRPEEPPTPLGYVFALARAGNSLYAGLQNGGVWVSIDQGVTWDPMPINNVQNDTIIDLVVVPGYGLYATTPNNGVYFWALPNDSMR